MYSIGREREGKGDGKEKISGQSLKGKRGREISLEGCIREMKIKGRDCI